MIGNKRVLALIPARSGSKGLPNKNLLPLSGKPLVVWSIESAKSSKYVDNIVLTTDSDQIRKIGIEAGAEAPFLRPAELAGDRSPTIDAVIHALDYYSFNLKIDFDYIALLEPTSPIRNIDDIDEMIEKLDREFLKFDAIVSLGNVREHPALMKKIEGEIVVPFDSNQPFLNRRQDLEATYFPFGVCYLIKVDALRKFKTFYPSRTGGFIIKDFQCVEIDDLYDFKYAEILLETRP